MCMVFSTHIARRVMSITASRLAESAYLDRPGGIFQKVFSAALFWGPADLGQLNTGHKAQGASFWPQLKGPAAALALPYCFALSFWSPVFLVLWCLCTSVSANKGAEGAVNIKGPRMKQCACVCARAHACMCVCVCAIRLVINLRSLA